MAGLRASNPRARNRCELARRTASITHPSLYTLCLAGERYIVRCCIVPAGDDTNKGLPDLCIRQPQRMQARYVNSMCRTYGVGSRISRLAPVIRHDGCWQA